MVCPSRGCLESNRSLDVHSSAADHTDQEPAVAVLGRSWFVRRHSRLVIILTEHELSAAAATRVHSAHSSFSSRWRTQHSVGANTVTWNQCLYVHQGNLAAGSAQVLATDWSDSTLLVCLMTCLTPVVHGRWQAQSTTQLVLQLHLETGSLKQDQTAQHASGNCQHARLLKVAWQPLP